MFMLSLSGLLMFSIFVVLIVVTLANIDTDRKLKIILFTIPDPRLKIIKSVNIST